MRTRHLLHTILISAGVALMITDTPPRGLNLRAQASSAVEIDCQGICTTVPPEEQMICMEACREALGEGNTSGGAGGEVQQQQTTESQQSTGLTQPVGSIGGGSFAEPFETPPAPAPASAPSQPQRPAASTPVRPIEPAFTQPLAPAPPQQSQQFAPVPAVPVQPAPEECVAVPFRQSETRFCILADRCVEARLAKRGFAIDPSCQSPVNFTRTYRTKDFRTAEGSLHGSAPSPGDDFIAVLNRTIFAVDRLLPSVPRGTEAEFSIRDLRNYLLTVLGNLARHRLTMLEREATEQYLRLRLLETIGLLRAAGVDIAAGDVSAPSTHEAAPEPEKPFLER